MYKWMDNFNIYKLMDKWKGKGRDNKLMYKWMDFFFHLQIDGQMEGGKEGIID